MRFKYSIALLLIVVALSGCRRKKYENPITQDTQQPDKVLFDKAINDIERSRFEVARLTLNTLMNTYDTSEFLAKAKLAIADSWFREGGSHALAQAEAEYKDFILFYPTLEEAAEAQEKVCNIHYKQMEKPDRDPKHAIRAEEECRHVLVQFPNSRFAPRVQQILRNIQEVLGEAEFRAGSFYYGKGSHYAASNRLQAMVDQYPLYSRADESLWMLGDSYGKMGERFNTRSVQSYQRIVRDYPLSPFAEEARKKLGDAAPEPDPVAVARMKYEQANRERPGIMSPVWGVFSKSPNTREAAKSGAPAMTSLRPSIPESVPRPAGTPGFSGEVTVGGVPDSSALDTKPDARLGPAGQPQTPATPEAQTAPAPGQQPSAAPSKPNSKAKKKEKKK